MIRRVSMVPLDRACSLACVLSCFVAADVTAFSGDAQYDVVVYGSTPAGIAAATAAATPKDESSTCLSATNLLKPGKPPAETVGESFGKLWKIWLMTTHSGHMNLNGPSKP